MEQRCRTPKTPWHRRSVPTRRSASSCLPLGPRRRLKSLCCLLLPVTAPTSYQAFSLEQHPPKEPPVPLGLRPILCRRQRHLRSVCSQPPIGSELSAAHRPPCRRCAPPARTARGWHAGPCRYPRVPGKMSSRPPRTGSERSGAVMALPFLSPTETRLCVP